LDGCGERRACERGFARVDLDRSDHAGRVDMRSALAQELLGVTGRARRRVPRVRRLARRRSRVVRDTNKKEP
jgi:hypothetical protein